MSSSSQPLPHDAEERGRGILRAVMGLVAEVAIDLEVTWHHARAEFATVLFERAGHRYKTAQRVATALQTSLRTVRQYRRRSREDEDAPAYNARRRVLHMLDAGAVTRAELERALPASSDADYAAAALASLLDDGLVVHDPQSDSYRKAASHVRPWYLRREAYDVERLRRRLRYLARLLGSRVTPKAEDAQIPAALIGLYYNLPSDKLEEFVRDLRETLERFDRRWEAIAATRRADAPTVLAGGVMAFGHLGDPIDRDDVDPVADPPEDERPTTVD